MISICLLCTSTLSLTNYEFVKAAAAFLCFARRQKGYICHTHTELLLALFKNLFGLWQVKGRGNMQTRSLPPHVLSFAFRVFWLMTSIKAYLSFSGLWKWTSKYNFYFDVFLLSLFFFSFFLLPLLSSPWSDLCPFSLLSYTPFVCLLLTAGYYLPLYRGWFDVFYFKSKCCLTEHHCVNKKAENYSFFLINMINPGSCLAFQP